MKTLVAVATLAVTAMVGCAGEPSVNSTGAGEDAFTARPARHAIVLAHLSP